MFDSPVTAAPRHSSATAGWLAGLVLIALIPRVAAAVLLGNEFHFADEANYLDTAHRLLSGNGFGRKYLSVPAYPVFLAALAAPLAATLMWVRIAQAVVAALGAGLTFTVADRLIGRPAAVAAALMYALDPLLVVAAALLYPEAVAATVMLGLVWFAWDAARRDSLTGSGLAGLLLGLLALFRPVALLVVPVVALWISLSTGSRPARRILHAGLVGLLCVGVLAPWTYRNYRVYGRLSPISRAGTPAAPVPADEVERRGLTVALLHEAWREPLVLGGRMGREFRHFWELTPERLVTDDTSRRELLHRRDPRLPVAPAFPRSLRDAVSAASSAIELILGLAGVVLVWKRRRPAAVLLLSIVLVYALGYALFVGKLRYRIPILPLVFLFAGAAAATLYGAIGRQRT
ncbi:MAG: glycosyltransferase family 39 protein [Gemmatimonadales bacterium]